eukprot:UN05412
MIGDIILVFVFAAVLYFLYWVFTPIYTSICSSVRSE